MIFLLLLSALVHQQGDTLIFTEQDSVIEKWILNEEDSCLMKKTVKQAKVSPNNERFLIYQEEYDEENYLIGTKLTFYDASKKELWGETRDATRKLSYHLSNIFDSLFIIADTDRKSRNPNLYLVRRNRAHQIVEEGLWTMIFNYEISPNFKYIAMHCRKPYSNRLWDYIYSFDLEAKTDWEYLFPVCTTCKRGKIAIEVRDNGEVEVIYRNKHRVFSHEGKLIDAFIKIE